MNQYFNTAGSSSNNQSQPLVTQSAQQCYRYWGWGHMAKEYATPLTYLKGGVPMSLLPRWKKSKGARSSANSTTTDPMTLKTIKEQYHNPDAIAWLVGWVNEACILIDDVECIALVDLGAQISTITIEFIKQLGLKIYQLDR